MSSFCTLSSIIWVGNRAIGSGEKVQSFPWMWHFPYWWGTQEDAWVLQWYDQNGCHPGLSLWSLQVLPHQHRKPGIPLLGWLPGPLRLQSSDIHYQLCYVDKGRRFLCVSSVNFCVFTVSLSCLPSDGSVSSLPLECPWTHSTVYLKNLFNSRYVTLCLWMAREEVHGRLGHRLVTNASLCKQCIRTLNTDM